MGQGETCPPPKFSFLFSVLRSNPQRIFSLHPANFNVYLADMITWQKPGRPVILASQSPRRREILVQMGIEFEAVTPAPIDESSFIDPANLEPSLRGLAAEKARSIAAQHPDALVLGADTVVIDNCKVLGKPSDRTEAKNMLRSLSGKPHRVITAVALLCTSAAFHRTALASTDVFFRSISDEEIDTYLDCGEYRDKAGAYAIQGRAMIFIDTINGCFYNVVGLPVAQTYKLFCDFIHSSGAVNKHAQSA
jgi:septum formation protein